MSCNSKHCHHGSKEHLSKDVCQANIWLFSRGQIEMSIMNQAYWEQIGYTDSHNPWWISEFYFDGDYGQEGDGDIVSVAI